PEGQRRGLVRRPEPRLLDPTDRAVRALDAEPVAAFQELLRHRRHTGRMPAAARLNQRCSSPRSAFSNEAATGFPFESTIPRPISLPSNDVPVRSQWRSTRVPPPSRGSSVAETKLPAAQKLLSTTVQRTVFGSDQS